jgi:hypothetical protein
MSHNAQLTAQFFISLFFKDSSGDKDTRFFFGRTVQTDPIKLSGRAGSFGMKGDSKPYFIHSNLPSIHNNVPEKVLTVIELVLRGENNKGEPIVFSGGY